MRRRFNTSLNQSANSLLQSLASDTDALQFSSIISLHYGRGAGVGRGRVMGVALGVTLGIGVGLGVIGAVAYVGLFGTS